MASIEEIRNVRLEKIEILKKAGMEPYPASVPRDMSLGDVRGGFAEREGDGNTYAIAGRVMAIRGAGAIMFVVLQDGADQFQAVFKKDSMDEDTMQLFKDTIDIGDFVSVTGTFFKTQKGEPSLLVSDWVIASKALLPLPEKWAGLEDVEEKRRRRYLDAVSDNSVFERFQKRSEIIQAMRTYFDDKGFMEVETPILQNQAGGAMARVFETHHNDYDIDMVLRIALEIEHKMMMAAGYERVYEIGKNFRNEGSDPTHIQEFTMIEWYAAYATLEDNMAWTEELLKKLANDVAGKTTFTVYDKEGNTTEVDFAGDWSRKKFNDLLQEYAGISVQSDLETVQKKAKELGMSDDEIKKTSQANLLDFVYKKTARPTIVNPTFVIDYPGDLKPLAQQNDDSTARVAQLIIAGAEITNQYAELVDPVKQRELLESQAAAKAAGDEEAMSLNEEFITAMEHGMPPMTGFGLGVDRLVAILTEQKNLRDVIFFPIMRPRENE